MRATRTSKSSKPAVTVKARAKAPVRMDRDDYVGEHRKLVKVLKHPTKAGLKAEAKEQSEDLREARKR